jgi:hypothetical protein
VDGSFQEQNSEHRRVDCQYGCVPCRAMPASIRSDARRGTLAATRLNQRRALCTVHRAECRGRFLFSFENLRGREQLDAYTY